MKRKREGRYGVDRGEPPQYFSQVAAYDTGTDALVSRSMDRSLPECRSG